MSHEGVTLVARAALIGCLIVVVATLRAAVGPSKRRGRVMLAGTLGGVSVGVLVAQPLSLWFKADVSGLSACLGIALGWCVSWWFARRIPREAH
jgi:hypothetical protein